MKYRNQFLKYHLFQKEGDAGTGGTGSENNGGTDDSGGGGGSSNDWRSGLPDDLRTAPALEQIKDVNSLAKGYLELKSYQGSSIRIPGDDASDDARKEFTQKLLTKVPTLMPKPDLDAPEQSREFFMSLGMPEKPELYTAPKIEPPEGINYDASVADRFKTIAHKHGLTDKQFKGIVSEMANSGIQAAQQAKEKRSSEMHALSQEWGYAFDNNIKSAAAIAERTGAPAGLVNAIKSKNVDVATVKWLHGLSKKFSGEGAPLAGDNAPGGNSIMAPSEARAKISEMMNNKAHPYWVASDPGHAAALKRMIELQTLANPNSSTNADDLRAGTFNIS